MALRLNPVLEIAEVMNLRPRHTHGIIKLIDEEMPCMLDLAGDFYPDLQGKRIQISPNPKYMTAEDKASTLTPKQIHPHQVGTTGIVTAARWAKVPSVSEVEAAERTAAGELVPFEWKRMLYMEWFCQNGRVVLELIEPHIEIYVSGNGDDEVWDPFEWPDTKPDDPMAMEEFDVAEAARQAVPFGQHYKRPKMDGMFSMPSFKENDDDDAGGYEPEEGFDPIKELERMEEDAPSELDSYLADINRQRDEAAGLAPRDSLFDDIEGDDDRDDEHVDDVIEEMKYMDEILEGKHDSDPAMVNILGNYVAGRMTDGEAEVKLKEVLALLGLYGISIGICEHFSAKDTLRIIRDEWGLEAKIHPGLIGSGWVRGFMTHESCRECGEIAEREFQETDHEEMLRQGAELMEEMKRQRQSDLPFDDDGDVPF